MKTTKLLIIFHCDMCGAKETTWRKLPLRWEYIAEKHYCGSCKRLLGEESNNLTTTEIRKCLLTAPIKHIELLCDTKEVE